VAGDFNAGKLDLFYIISTSMSHVQPEEENHMKKTPHTKLSLALHLANLTIILSS
jgi:hypothetical protein